MPKHIPKHRKVFIVCLGIFNIMNQRIRGIHVFHCIFNVISRGRLPRENSIAARQPQANGCSELTCYREVVSMCDLSISQRS